MLLLTAAAAPTFSQEIIDRAVFSMGTTTEDALGRDWAYILWQPTDPGLVLDKKYAIYAKTGNAASPNPYERRGIALLQTNPQVIQALLNRAVNLGDDLVTLEDRLNALFVEVIPSGSLTLSEKLSAVIRGSVGRPDRMANLMLLGRLHPAVNFCIGLGFGTMIPAAMDSTFEIREYDVEKDRDLGVLGRVTVTAGNPVILPAPGAPVQVPEANAKGDLNVKLRWPTSANLRRLALLSYGFNVYRMPRAYAESENFDVTPPSPSQLRALVGSEPDVVQVNNVPVLKTKDYSAATVADFVADPDGYFLADDNQRYREGGEGFANGSQYYYFVTARDVLGRDGLVSPGGLATVCDRVPPDAPSGIKVENDYSYDGANAKQVLRVVWEQNDNPAQDTVVSYYVYRWVSPSEVQVHGANPVINRIAGPIPHVPGEKYNHYVDDGAGSPQAPADYGKTFWYTVRAVDDGACNGGNFSANSRPAFGVLRDRTGPGAPNGRIQVFCCLPSVQALSPEDVRYPDPQDPARSYYRLVAVREDPGIQWAEFYYRPENAEANRFITRLYFPRGANEVQAEWDTPRAEVDQDIIPFVCRVGTIDGKTATAENPTTRSPKQTTVRVVPFDAKLECDRVTLARSQSQKEPCGNRHNPHPPGSDGTVGIDIVINLTPGSKEYKLYRRVDFGALTLIKQAPADFDDAAQIVVTDPDMPANSGTVCYYGQLFDEHGNASPLTLLQNCLTIQQPTATPLLARLETLGDASNPKMKIRWFCPPYGIERFEVSIATQFSPPAGEISPELSPPTAAGPVLKEFTIDDEARTNSFNLFRTPVVGPAFGNGAQFEVTADINLGFEYTVMVAAVGKDGSVNQDSNAESLLWTEPVPVGPDVPWPARPLPPLNLVSNVFAARLRPPTFDGVGVAIGEFDRSQWIGEPRKDGEVPLTGWIDPNELVHRDRNGRSLLPLLIYRFQVPNAEYPNVSGDLVQVSPLMEEIAYDWVNQADLGNMTVVRDPFIALTEPRQITDNFALPGFIYLLDTQPVIEGARYGYLVVRLAENREILEIIPTAAVDIVP